MTESYTLEELISGYFDKEFSDVAEVSLPKFSLKHRIVMRSIFRKFADNAYNKSSTNQTVYVPSKPISIRKRLIIVAIIIIGMAILTGFVIMFISNGFKGKVYHDNTHLFAVNTEWCPTKIEKVYKLSVLPDGYEFVNSSFSNEYVFTTYMNKNKAVIYFIQYVKSEFSPHINTEGVNFRETTVGQCSAVYEEHNIEGIVDSIVIWDNQDYILRLSGNFTKDEIVKLAEINENTGF